MIREPVGNLRKKTKIDVKKIMFFTDKNRGFLKKLRSWLKARKPEHATHNNSRGGGGWVVGGGYQLL